MSEAKQKIRGKVRQLELLRANKAHAAVTDADRDLGSNASIYRQAARSAGADIMSNGLGQTLAFWFSKKGKQKAYEQINNDVSAWVLQEMQGIGTAGEGDTDLLEWITATGRTRKDYQRARAEAIAFLVWLKRYAEALIATDEPGGAA